MFNQVAFGEKLKSHRKLKNLTQEEVAEKIGVSGQAVSKWEKGECLPDCYNLKMLGDLYGISLDVLLNMDGTSDFEMTLNKIKQVATEFIWSKFSKEEKDNGHVDLGDNLWEMWKVIYYIEIGNKEIQEREMKHANNRIGSKYGLKAWHEDGVACVIKSSLLNKIDSVTDDHLSIMQTLTSDEYFNLIKYINCDPADKESLIEKTGFTPDKINEMLLYLMEKNIIEYYTKNNLAGYKLNVKRGIVSYLILAASYMLTSTRHSTSEYLPG